MEFVPHHVVIISTIYPPCTQIFVQACLPYFCFQMAEEGWTQGFCQAAPGFPSLLINALESLALQNAQGTIAESMSTMVPSTAG